MDVLMERAPRDLDADAIRDAVTGIDGVEAVHHVHVWSLGSERAALSAHVVLTGEPSLHAAQLVGNEIRTDLAHRFGIDHATLELECHDCADTVHAPRSDPA
jgi:cobalt-zinc-cadmium efflux system protein